jgi:ketosteroid isomerase-like protein
MSGRNDVEAFVRGIYERRKSGDIEGIIAGFAPDAQFRLAGDAALAPLTTAVRSHAPLRGLMEQLVAAWDWSDYRVDAVLVDGNRVAVYGNGTMHYGPGKAPFVTETFDLLTIEGGKIVDFVQFCDTHSAARAMGLGA